VFYRHWIYVVSAVYGERKVLVVVGNSGVVNKASE